MIWKHQTLGRSVLTTPQKLALTSPASSSCLVGRVRSRTQATEFVLFVINYEKVSADQNLTIGVVTIFFIQNNLKFRQTVNASLRWTIDRMLYCIIRYQALQIMFCINIQSTIRGVRFNGQHFELPLQTENWIYHLLGHKHWLSLWIE
jgi:hypothetical protein